MPLGDTFANVSSGEIRRVFRLLPSERLLWSSAPVQGIPRAIAWTLGPAIALVLATVSALFASLLRVAALPGWEQSALVAFYFGIIAVSALLLPRYLHDRCEFAITDRRVLWRRGGSVRSIDSHGISFARVRWHGSIAGIGRLELVRAEPFGPLSRSARIVFHDIRAPDAVLAIARGVEASPNAGDGQLSIAERLEPGEEVLWGAGPEGRLLGWRDILTALGGVVVIGLGIRYGYDAIAILAGLEEVGLPVGSVVWTCLFLATLLTFGLILGVGGFLVWWGVVNARAEGRSTEYLVTDRRLLIRRGRSELSLDRSRIFDLAETHSWLGLRTVFLILDGPGAKALRVSGARSALPPPRDPVHPVLYELSDTSELRALLAPERTSHEPHPPLRDAA